jgi:hypothetical protein
VQRREFEDGVMFIDTYWGAGYAGLKRLRFAEQRQMNLIRCTIIDGEGGVSFLTHGDAIPALVAACATSPGSMDQLLGRAESYYAGLVDYVGAGLAVFDEHNTAGHYETIHRALTTQPRHKQPVFRIVDDLTREASLRPVKAGLIIFNLGAKRIVQMVNSYREIQRSGGARVFDGRAHTAARFRYKLPEEWALVP